MEIKEKIRKIEFEGLAIGGDSNLSFMGEEETKPIFALEIPFVLEENIAPILQKMYDEDFEKRFLAAERTSCDLVCIKFNLDDTNLKEQIELSKQALENVQRIAKKPLMIKGTNNIESNKKVLPKLIETLKRPCIIAYVDENTYETVVPMIVDTKHIVVLRSPIDINLAKELNILSIDKGLKPEQIIIDTDMGALGYGLDYGYSIMEKIKLAGFDGDTMLNMPMVSFVGEETFKTKEAKKDSFDSNWGQYEQRAIMFEVATTASVISAGANLVVVNHPKTIETIKELLWN